MRALFVAEKNDAAKGISQILSKGNSVRTEGRSKYNKIYKFNLPQFQGRPNVEVLMTSVSGHLYGLDFGANYRNWQSVRPSELFDAPVERTISENMKPIRDTLVDQARRSEVLVIWTDCDREGENIGFEVITTCRGVKPGMRVYRARFSEITPTAVNRALANLVDPNQNMSSAVDCRTELDLRIGAAFTRLQTLYLRNQFVQLSDGRVISYGSCQFPTLGFVVDRYKRVQEFIPEPFWKLVVVHTKNDVRTEFGWQRGRLFEREPVEVLQAVCREANSAAVTSVKQKPKSRWRPVAMDTIEMEKLAVRKLRMSAKEAMTIAERLYNQGLISYPRTETNKFPDNFDLQHLIGMQEADPQWGNFAGVVTQRGPNPRNGRKSDQAHPPIHPTKYSPPGQLNGNDRRVYELVVRHFIACCSWDASGQETEVDVELGGEQFSTSGLIIVDRAFLDVYPYENWNAKTIPNYAMNEQFIPDDVQLVDGQTSPPSLLTEADLISLMDRHGIGTDATHAEHIETIKKRQYVGLREDNRFVPGYLGLGLVEGYDVMGSTEDSLSKPNFRAQLERDLVEICEGTKNKDDVLREQVDLYRRIFLNSEQRINSLRQAVGAYFGPGGAGGGGGLPPGGGGGGGGGGNGDDGDDDAPRPGGGGPNSDGHGHVQFGACKCPKCDRLLQLRQMKSKTKAGKSDFFLGCPGYSDPQNQCRGAVWLPKETLDDAQLDPSTCDNCGGVNKIQFKFSRGKRPAGIRTNNFIGCIGCNEKLITWLQTSQNVPPPAITGGEAVAPKECRCQPPQPSVVRQVKKEGPNQGKYFYACARGGGGSDAEGCNFFEWVKQVPTASNKELIADRSQQQPNANPQTGGGAGILRTQNNGAANTVSNAPRRNYSTQQQEQQVTLPDSVPTCGCNQPAKQLVTKKPGPNQGRQFYKCSTGQCDYFAWADQVNAQPVGQHHHHHPDQQQQQQQQQQPMITIGNNSKKCKCNLDAVDRKVAKQGENTGRAFWCCSKQLNDPSNCKFFEWID